MADEVVTQPSATSGSSASSGGREPWRAGGGNGAATQDLSPTLRLRAPQIPLRRTDHRATRRGSRSSLWPAPSSQVAVSSEVKARRVRS